MEGLHIRPFLRSQKTSTQTLPQLHKEFTSPKLDEYETMTQKYKNYLSNMNAKIDKICEKQKQRTLFKQRKLNNIKTQLTKKKHSLQCQLSQKLDPDKSENGRLHKEISTLKKLEFSYQEIYEQLALNVEKKENENSQLQKTVKEQRNSIKQNIKTQFVNSNNRVLEVVKRKSIMDMDSSRLSQKSKNSYISKSKQNFINKLSISWQQKIKTKLDHQEQKLQILQILCVYCHNQSPEGSTLAVVKTIQKDIKQKVSLIAEIKQLLSQEENDKITSQ